MRQSRPTARKEKQDKERFKQARQHRLTFPRLRPKNNPRKPTSRFEAWLLSEESDE